MNRRMVSSVTRVSRVGSLLLAGILSLAARADPAPFDLAGPNIEVDVTRGGQTLPVFEVPNLSANDHLSIKADLPATQSEHYLMVVAFLRGSINPPPPGWFFRCETWTQKCTQEGLTVTVPETPSKCCCSLHRRPAATSRRS